MCNLALLEKDRRLQRPDRITPSKKQGRVEPRGPAFLASCACSVNHRRHVEAPVGAKSQEFGALSACPAEKNSDTPIAVAAGLPEATLMKHASSQEPLPSRLSATGLLYPSRNES